MALVHAFLAGREKNAVSWHALPTARTTGCVNKTPHVSVTRAREVQGVRRRLCPDGCSGQLHETPSYLSGVHASCSRFPFTSLITHTHSKVETNSTSTNTHPPLPHSGERQISVVFFSLPIRVRRSGAHQNVEEGTLFHIAEIWVACPPHNSARKQQFGRPLSIEQNTLSLHQLHGWDEQSKA